ncbi:hypothetical protein Tco_1041704 [Tanacetum coccineum]|uniref:Uncharacterized protein n=1 Tax=Tanacetum coccineum TaxID=301880 RepID=A0ABQ5GHN6_9ASTR
MFGKRADEVVLQTRFGVGKICVEHLVVATTVGLIKLSFPHGFPGSFSMSFCISQLSLRVCAMFPYGLCIECFCNDPVSSSHDIVVVSVFVADIDTNFSSLVICLHKRQLESCVYVSSQCFDAGDEYEMRGSE